MKSKIFTPEILCLVLTLMVSLSSKATEGQNPLTKETTKDLLNCAYTYSMATSEKLPFVGQKGSTLVFAGTNSEGEAGFYVSNGSTHLFYKGGIPNQPANSYGFRSGIFKLKPRTMESSPLFVSHMLPTGEIKVGRSSVYTYDKLSDDQTKKNPQIPELTPSEVDEVRFKKVLIEQVFEKNAEELQLSNAKRVTALKSCGNSLKADSRSRFIQMTMKPEKGSPNKERKESSLSGAQ